MKNAKLCLVLFSIFVSTFTYAGVAVIVHPSNANSIGEEDVQRLFLGKSKSFSGGGDALPINSKETGSRDQFNQNLLGKNESQVKAYWSQLVFTGKGTPPKELDSDDAVKAFVAANPNAIGYIDASKVDATVKAIITK